MSSPFGEDRPGRSGGEDSTAQWRPVEGQAWSNVPGMGAETPRDSGAPGGPRTGGYPAVPGGYPGGPGGYPGGPGYHPGSYPGGPGPYPTDPRGFPPPQQPQGGGAGRIALIIVVMLLLVAAGAGLGYWIMSREDPSGEGAVARPGSEQPQPGSTPAQRRAEGFEAPANWSHCGGSGAPGDLNLYYAGTGTTSCPFTKAVRDAFVDHYNATDRLEGTITAFSPVTRRNYTMTCTDDGDYVTCRGGNNAVVHIV